MKSTASKFFLFTLILYSPLFVVYIDEISSVPPFAFTVGIILFYVIFRLFIRYFRDPRATKAFAFKKMQVDGNRTSPSLILWLAIMYCCTQLVIIATPLAINVLTMVPDLNFYNGKAIKLLVPIIALIIFAIFEWKFLKPKINNGWIFKTIIIITALLWFFNFINSVEYDPIGFFAEYKFQNIINVIQILFVTFGNWIIISMCIDSDSDFAKFDATTKATYFFVILIIFMYIIDYLFAYNHLATNLFFTKALAIMQFFVYYKILVELIHNGELVKVTKKLKNIDQRYLAFALFITFLMIEVFFNLSRATLFIWAELFLVFVWATVAITSKNKSATDVIRNTIILAVLAIISFNQSFLTLNDVQALVVWFLAIFVFQSIFKLSEYDPVVVYRHAYYFYDVHGSVLIFSKFHKELRTLDHLELPGEKFNYEYMKENFALPECEVIDKKPEIYLSSDKLQNIHYTAHNVYFKTERPELESMLFVNSYWHDTKNILEFGYNKSTSQLEH